MAPEANRIAHTEKLGSITLRGSIGLTDYMSFDVSGYDADVSVFIPKDIPVKAGPILISLTGTLRFNRDRWQYEADILTGAAARLDDTTPSSTPS